MNMAGRVGPLAPWQAGWDAISLEVERSGNVNKASTARLMVMAILNSKTQVSNMHAFDAALLLKELPIGCW